MVIVKKIKFNINQLVGAECFLGYHRKVWDPRINFFLLGRRYNHDVFDLNHTRLILRSLMHCLMEMFNKKCHLWFIANNFVEFSRVKELGLIKAVLSNQVTFNINSWLGGCLSNYKHSIHDGTPFPHVIFTADSSDNFSVINEAYSIRIPSISLVDSNSSPNLSFFCIPSNTKGFRPIFLFSTFIIKTISYSRVIIAGKFLFSSFLKARRRLSNLKKTSKLFSKLSGNYFTQIIKFFIMNFLDKKKEQDLREIITTFDNKIIAAYLRDRLIIEEPLEDIFSFFQPTNRL